MHRGSIPGSMPTLIEHVERLCREVRVEEIRIIEDWRDSSSNTPNRLICAPAITSVDIYFIWLHELGHMRHGHRFSLWAPWDEVQRGEAEAWNWAFQKALVRPDEQALLNAAAALKTYETPHTDTPSPTPDPAYAKLMNRLMQKVGGEIPDIWSD